MVSNVNQISAICFPLFTLFIGLAISFLISRLPSSFHLPFTLVVFLVGFIMAVVIFFRHSMNDALDPSVHQWESINPDLMRYCFLPPLLFSEAMSFNFHQVKSGFWPAVLLAGPGAIASAYMQAAMVYLLLSPNWSWRLCLIVGTILCATDPVSVIEILKSISTASMSTIRLTYLITGEALLNDATGLVMFSILMDSSSRRNGSTLFSFIVEVVMLSPLIGGAMGLATVYFLRIANRRVHEYDTTMQLVATICCAYSSFYFVQYSLGFSGVLSCCSAGVVLSWLAPSLLLKPTAVEAVWQTLAWLANTLIFMIAGLIVGRNSIEFVRISDVGIIFFVYATMLGIRIGIVMCAYIPLNMMAARYSLKDLLFVSFAGLRGAISLSLVLELDEASSTSSSSASSASSGRRVFPAEQVHRAAFILCGAIALSIAVNGTLAPWVMHLLGITSSSDSTEDSIVLHYVEKRLRKAAEDHMVEMKLTLPLHDAAKVREVCSIFPAVSTEQLSCRDQDPNHDSEENQTQLRIPSSLQQRLAAGTPEEDSWDSSCEVFSMRVEGSMGTSPAAESNLMAQMPGCSTKVTSMPGETANITSLRLSNHPQGEEGEDEESWGTPARIRGTPADATSECRGGGDLSPPRTGRIPRSTSNLSMTPEGSVAQYPTYKDVSRSVESAVLASLMVKLRHVFLEVVRRHYHKQVKTGRLPRGSNAALILLSSIDIGLETSHTPNLQDWDALESSLDSSIVRGIVRRLFQSPTAAPDTNISVTWGWRHCVGLIQAQLAATEFDYSVDEIYAITSFIAAHEYAQQTIALYLGETEFIDTPEEALVVAESQQLVVQARARLAAVAAASDACSAAVRLQAAGTDCTAVDVGVEPAAATATPVGTATAVQRVATHQVASMLLHREEDIIVHLLEEGIISMRDAEKLFSVCRKDLEGLSSIWRDDWSPTRWL